MPFEYYQTKVYSGSAASNPDVYYTSSNSASYAGGFIVVTGSADIHLTEGENIRATDLNSGEFYPFEVKRISGGASAYIYVLRNKG